MKTRKLHSLTLALILSMMPVLMPAQDQVQRAFDRLVGNNNVTVSNNIERLTTPSLPGNPLSSLCNVYTFSMGSDNKYLIKDIIDAFNRSKNDANSYSSNQRIDNKLGDYHNLYIGDNPDKTISVGQDGSNYVLQCWRDNQRSAYRYAYALEWKEQRNNRDWITGRLIITYAKIPEEQSNKDMMGLPGTENKNTADLYTIKSSEEALLAFARLKGLIRTSLNSRVDVNGTNNIDGIAMTIYHVVNPKNKVFSFSSGEKKFLKSEVADMIKDVKRRDKFLIKNRFYTKNCNLYNAFQTAINYLELGKKTL